MIKRFIGPFLMVAFGATLLLGPGEPAPLDVGTSTPCTTIVQPAIIVDPCSTTTTTDPCGPMVGVVNPCTTTTVDPCGPMVGVVNPCTTTTEAQITTTTLDPCGPSAVGVVSPCTSTTVVETTDPPAVDGSTTEPSAALPDGVTSDPPAASPATASGQLVRTGSSSGPLTVAGVSLIALGAGLAIYERRNAARRSA